jgi:hypothetical protein
VVTFRLTSFSGGFSMYAMIRLVMAVAVIVCLVSVASSATRCSQMLELVGKSSGEGCDCIQFKEYLSGECQDSIYHLLIFPKQAGGGTVPIVTTVDDRMEDCLGHKTADSVVSVSNRQGKFYLDDASYFEAPAFDSTFTSRLNADAYADDAQRWYCMCKQNCADFLQFSGVTATLVYVHDRGLYKNYSIKEAWYWPESKTLLVITHQMRKSAGHDTMHGVLVYHLD